MSILNNSKDHSSPQAASPDRSRRKETAQPHMGKKKMKLPGFLFKFTSETRPSSWPWPSCNQQPRTLSFRSSPHDIFRTINSAFVDNTADVGQNPERVFSNLSQLSTFALVSEDGEGDQIEKVLKGVRSERLFVQLGETSSILEEVKEDTPSSSSSSSSPPFKESVVLSMDSRNPYLDFRKSMEEMVEAHGLKDWKGLEELLSWYLTANGKSNHEYIIGAFVDLLVGLAFSSSSSSSCSCNSPSSLRSFCNTISSSSFSSSSLTATPCISSVEVEETDSSSTPWLSSLLEEEESVEEIKEEDDASS